MADETRELQLKVSNRKFLWSLDKLFLGINIRDSVFTILCFEPKEVASCIFICIE